MYSGFKCVCRVYVLLSVYMLCVGSLCIVCSGLVECKICAWNCIDGEVGGYV